MAANYRALKLMLDAEIAGVAFDKDCVQFSSTFEMNSIPAGALNVAVGVDSKTGNPAKIHKVMQQIKYNAPAKVWLTVQEYNRQGVAANDLRDGRYLVFDGYATGIGWMRATGGASCIINLQHWLADLDHTSALSGVSHPGNPSDWTYSSSFREVVLGAEGAAGAGGLPLWCPVPGGQDAALVTNLKQFWGGLLKPWLINIAKESDGNALDPRLPGGAAAANANAAVAAAALERIIANPELAIDTDGVDDGEAIASGIRHALGRETWQAWANTTIWGKLVGEWSPAYWFAIVPRVENAMVVPFCGGLRGTPFREILTSEYNQCELSAALPRGLRAVGIIHPVGMSCGGSQDVAGIQASRTGLAACWNPTPYTGGIVLLKEPPRWLCDPTEPYIAGYAVTGDAGHGAVGTVFDQQGVGKDAEGAAARDPAKTENDMKTMLQRVAQQWFAAEMLKGRVGELSGRLRFDVAPGSQVRVWLGSSGNHGSDDLAAPLYGTVARVSSVINAEMQKAGTAFALAHLRTETENKDDRYSVAKPPLYEEPWSGATLQDT